MNRNSNSAPARRSRRQYPRIAISRPVALRQGDNPPVTLQMANISPGGMQVRCDRKTAAGLCPGKTFSQRNAPSPVDAHLILPIHRGQVPVRVKCLIVHVSLIAGADPETEVAVGVKFRVFRDQRSLRHFMMFIEEQLVPLEDFDVYLDGPTAGPTNSADARSATKSSRPRPSLKRTDSRR